MFQSNKMQVLGLLGVLLFLSNVSTAQTLCRHIEIRGGEISLSETETRLVCGDPTREAWKNVPLTQGLFHLRTFLQDRGYYNTRSDIERGRATVNLGSQTFVSSLRADGLPAEIPLYTFRRVRQELLTPAFLDRLRDRMMGRLRSEGYACPKIDLQADPKSGEIRMRITPGARQNVVSVTEEPIGGIDKRILRRYDAFRIGSLYNDDYLRVTAIRTVDEGVVQSTHFLPECTAAGVNLTQRTIDGPPRRVSFGLGADTERGPRAKASWRHQRLGEMASNFEVSVLGSYRQQEIRATSNWYYLPWPSRHQLRPVISFRHDNERAYKSFKGDFQVGPTLTWDTENIGFTASIGPSLTWEHRYWPAPVFDTYFSSLRAELRMQSHYSEFYRNSPRTGFDVQLFGLFARQGWFSDVSAQKIGLQFEYLWNLNSYDPPLVVFGFRGGLSTTFSDMNPATLERLPPSFRNFLGGPYDVRGFPRGTLSGQPVNAESGQGPGALTAATASFEVRLTDVVPWGLQPLMFVDAGLLGMKPVSFEAPFFWSPGLGTRWESPVGVIRVTGAYGYVEGNRGTISPEFGGWRFFLSYGEEF